MFSPVIYIIWLLNLLCLTIYFRKFCRVASSGLFTGGWLLTASVLVFCLAEVFKPAAAAVCILIVLTGYVRFLFEGSFRRILLILATFLICYGLCLLVAWMLLEKTGIFVYNPQEKLDVLAQTLLAQQLFYTLLFIWDAWKARMAYAVTYYFPILPLLITIIVLLGFSGKNAPPVVRPYLIYGVLLMLIFDYLCLVLQGWLLISLHTRMKVRQEKARREYLAGKYAVLSRQYETSFGFLHTLLRQCASLSLSVEARDVEQIRRQVRDVADHAFLEFNQVCISSPVLQKLLDERQSDLEQDGILVSCAIRNDQFGLITFDEQQQLFSSLLDVAQQAARQAPGPARTIIIRSDVSSQDLLLEFSFSCAEDLTGTPQLEALVLQLSREFKAGVRSRWLPQEGRMQIFVVIPLGFTELYEGTPFEKTQTGARS